jgi:hypothetical protein
MWNNRITGSGWKIEKYIDQFGIVRKLSSWCWDGWYLRYKPSKPRHSKPLRKNLSYRNNRRKSICRGRHIIKRKVID